VPQTKGEEISYSTDGLGEDAYTVKEENQVRASFYRSCIEIINNKKIVFIKIERSRRRNCGS